MTGESLHARTLPDSEVEEHLRLLREEGPRAVSLDHGWMLAELTDGRITGVRDPGTDWALSLDELPGHCAPLLAPTGADDWRVRDIHLFNTTEHVHLLGEDGHIRGWALTGTPDPDQPETLRPRTIGLLICAGTDRDEQLTGPHGALPAGLFRAGRFARVVNPDGTDRVLPGPFRTEPGTPIPVTRLHVRQYFTQHPSGAVGAHAARYLAIDPAREVPA